MSGWEKRISADLPLYQAPVLADQPYVTQGFTTRAGGVSAMPYDTLNLGTRVGDLPEAVQANRKHLWSALGFVGHQVALAEQVHGDQVATVMWGGMTPGADALITNRTDILLMLLFADCVPVYVLDPMGRSLGLAHAGWRGTVAGIVGKMVSAMQNTYGGFTADYLAAVGPCISAAHYEVGQELADRFHEIGAATALRPKDGTEGKYLLDLRRVIVSQLIKAGLRPEAISVCGADTDQERKDFFSHRRDGAATGRMAAFLALREKAG